jgi:drug/metabolite transporter (DMT)-like permease
MIYLLAAVASALVYGGADFIGGLTTRRANAVVIVFVSQMGGLVLLAMVLPWMPEAAPSRADYLWGASAGLASGIGVALLYRALAIGTMSVVAPTTAVTAVSIPVLVSVFLGERPRLFAVAGIALAIVSIVLVAYEKTSGGTTQQKLTSRRNLVTSLATALVSGIAFGFLFLSLARTNAPAGLWPLLVMNCVSVGIFGAMSIAGRRSLRMPVKLAALALVGGILDMLAHALYLFATRYGPLSVVVTLSSLYPATTVVLARIFLRERLNGWQITGICCALAAIVLIVRGST